MPLKGAIHWRTLAQPHPTPIQSANPIAQKDNDLDGLGDACDPDDDNDTCPDGSDQDPYSGTSVIGYKVAVNCSTSKYPVYGWDGEDSDGDGIKNCADSDDDNDGILDSQDPCPIHAGTQCQFGVVTCPFQEQWWLDCRLPGCNECLLRIVSLINPVPREHFFESFHLERGQVWVHPTAKRPADRIEEILLGERTRAARTQAERAEIPEARTVPKAKRGRHLLELWTKGPDGNPERKIRDLGEYDPLKVRRQPHTVGTVPVLQIPEEGPVTLKRSNLPTVHRTPRTDGKESAEAEP